MKGMRRFLFRHLLPGPMRKVAYAHYIVVYRGALFYVYFICAELRRISREFTSDNTNVRFPTSTIAGVVVFLGPAIFFHTAWCGVSNHFHVNIHPQHIMSDPTNRGTPSNKTNNTARGITCTPKVNHVPHWVDILCVSRKRNYPQPNEFAYR